MKDLIKQYLDQGVSRRNFLSALGGLGMTAAAADAMANSLAPFVPQEPAADGAPSWMRQMEGTGAALLSALTAAWAFLLGSLVAVAMIHHFLDSTTQFLALGAAALLVALMIRKLEKSENPILG